MKPTRILLLATSLAASLMMLAGCGGDPKHDENNSATQKAAPGQSDLAVDAATKLTIKSATIADLKPVAGRYTTADEVVARARIPGTLVQLLVDEGSYVRAGQVIGIIDEARMGAEVAARQASANAATSSAGAGQSGAVAAQAEVARARAMASQAPAALEQALAAQARAQADFDRTQILYDKGVYAKARLDQMEAARRVANAQVSAAQAGVSAALEGVNAAQAQAMVAQANARAAADQAKAARAQTIIASAMRAEGRIIAPRSGRVTLVPVTQGAVIMPGEAVAVIAGGMPVLKLVVPQADATQLQIGQTLAVTNADGAETGRAAILKVYPSVMNGQVEVDLDASNVRERFVGQRVSVLLPVGSRNAVMVPPSYLRTRAGVDYARILRGQLVMEVPVQRGSSQAAQIEVLSGLVAGDVIVAYPQSGARK